MGLVTNLYFFAGSLKYRIQTYKIISTLPNKKRYFFRVALNTGEYSVFLITSWWIHRR